jgi:methionyl-tRNA synthetase
VPHRVFGHGWLLVGGEKMSKSKLTGIAPQQITDVFGSDAFRYYFLRAITFGQDGSFSWEDLSARYQAELANGFGNLASRVLAMVERYRDGNVPVAPVDARFVELARTATAEADGAIERFAINEAIAHIWTLVDELNGYITDTAPWQLAKDPEKAAELDAVLATAVHVLGTLAILLSPVMPKATERLWTAIGGDGVLREQDVRSAFEWPQTGRVQPLDGTLFPRIEESGAEAIAV